MPIADDVTTGPAPKRKPTRSSAPTPAPQVSRPAPYERNNVTKLTPYSGAQGMSDAELEAAIGIDRAEQAAEIYNGHPGARAGGPAAVPQPRFAGLLSDTVRDAAQEAILKTAKAVQRKEEKPRTRKSYEMSWDDYQALSDEKRAAVDFNTLLIQAREKDLNTEYQPSLTEKQAYENQVLEMFGEDGGSETFAPETLGVLTQLDFEAFEDEDFDDFLSLKKTISEKELVKFAPEKVMLYTDVNPVDRLMNPEMITEPVGYTGEAQLAMNTAEMQQTLAEGNRLLDDFRRAFRLDRSMEVDLLGGTTPEVKLNPGWDPMQADNGGEKTIDQFYRDMYNAMSRRDFDAEQVWAMAVEGPAALSEQEQADYLAYASERARQAKAYGLELGEEKGAPYRSADEFLEMLGLSKGAGRG